MEAGRVQPDHNSNVSASSGPLSLRPNPRGLPVGVFYYDTDADVLYVTVIVANHTVWKAVGGGGASGGTALAFSGGFDASAESGNFFLANAPNAVHESIPIDYVVPTGVSQVDELRINVRVNFSNGNTLVALVVDGSFVLQQVVPAGATGSFLVTGPVAVAPGALAHLRVEGGFQGGTGDVLLTAVAKFS